MGKVLGEKFWKSVKNSGTILPFSCCPLVFLWNLFQMWQTTSLYNQKTSRCLRLLGTGKYGCSKVQVYPGECGEQLGRDSLKNGSSKSLVLKSFWTGEGTLWDSSLLFALTLWDTPVLCTPPLPLSWAFWLVTISCFLCLCRQCRQERQFPGLFCSFLLCSVSWLLRALHAGCFLRFPKGPKIEKIQDLEIFKRDWTFQVSRPPSPYFCGDFWTQGLTFSIEIDNFKRDGNVSIFGPLGVLAPEEPSETKDFTFFLTWRC